MSEIFHYVPSLKFFSAFCIFMLMSASNFSYLSLLHKQTMVMNSITTLSMITSPVMTLLSAFLAPILPPKMERLSGSFALSMTAFTVCSFM